MTQLRMTNNAGINLAAAVWLAHDDYDYINKPNYMSVTTLIKPVRQIVLGQRIDPKDKENIPDVKDRIQSSFGQALHSSIEHTWKNHYRSSLEKLGYPQRAIDAIEVNPEKADPEKIQVYTEIRTERIVIVNGIEFILGGKFDIVIEGRLQDVKKTSVWGYQKLKGIDDDKWRLQGSLYRWLNPDKISHDEMFIQYLLLDWAGSMLKRDPTYPPHALPHRIVTLYTVPEMDRWVHDKLVEYLKYKDAPEAKLPHCSDEDLWRTDPQYKYYSGFNPGDVIPASQKSTKNFDVLSDAMRHRAEKGKGVVVTFPGKVKACVYCPAAPLCGQRALLAAAGEIDE